MAINAAHMGIIRSLPLDDLLSLNRAVVDQIRTKRSVDTYRKLRQFEPGDFCTFIAKGRLRMIRVEKLNTKTASGRECDPKTRVPLPFGTTWRVHPSLLTKVSSTPSAPLTAV